MVVAFCVCKVNAKEANVQTVMLALNRSALSLASESDVP